MKCPFCRSTETEVYNTRATKFRSQLWRRRRCLSCHEAFTTYEAPDLGFIQVSSSDGSKRPYSRARLYAAVAAALDPAGTTASDIDAVTDTVESKLLDLKSPALTTTGISAIILTTLKNYDTSAFLRYLAAHADLRSRSELKRQLKNY
jgi:transcriptional repressor NrdR